MSPPKQVPPRPVSLGLLAIVLWSTTVAFARSLTEQVGPITAASLIYLLGGGVGCAVLAAKGKLRATLATLSPRYLLGCGGLFVFYMACLYAGVGLAADRSQVLEVGLLNYLWPTLTLLFSIPILNMRATPLLGPGVLVATLGMFLVTTQGQPLSWHAFQGNLAQNPLPYILGLLAAVSWGLYSPLSRRWAHGADRGAVPLFMLATGILLGVARCCFPETTHWTRRAVLELLYMAVGPNLGYVFWELAMRKGDIVLVIACSYATPFLSTGISCLYLGVQAGLKLWIGCVLIIGGAVLCKLGVREPDSAKSLAET